MLDIPIVRGRAFMPWERDHHPVAIVSESVARALWPDGRAWAKRSNRIPAFSRPAGSSGSIGAPADEGLLQTRMVTVIGVARDVRGFRITGIKEAGVFLPTGLDVAKTSIVARVQGDRTWRGKRCSIV